MKWDCRQAFSHLFRSCGLGDGVGLALLTLVYLGLHQRCHANCRHRLPSWQALPMTIALVYPDDTPALRLA